MDLQQLFLELAPPQRRAVQLALCAKALEVWEQYASSLGADDLTYYDGVVGVKHTVDVGLPADGLSAARVSADAAGVAERYSEPIVSLQDEDLVFPKNVEWAYYAIYNCFRLHALSWQIDDWLIVNQALSAFDK